MKLTILALSAAAVSGAALLTGATSASAQYDNPPGSAWQDRGLIEERSEDPNRYRTRRGYRESMGYSSRYRGGYGAYASGARSYGSRLGPPGSRFQSRGLREDNGFDRWDRGETGR